LSYECLESYRAREVIGNLKHTDPEFWQELTMECAQVLPKKDEVVEEDNIPKPDDMDWGWDDSDVPIDTAVQAMTCGDYVAGIVEHAKGGLMSMADAEDINFKFEVDEDDAVDEDKEMRAESVAVEDCGRGKHVKKASVLYKMKFWRH
jgi:hypothetical protein